MTQGDNFGGTLTTMRYRLLGTLFGAIFSYFVFIAVGQEFSHVLGMFFPYLLLCGYIRQNKDWSYFGTVSCFTALIVTYGIDSYSTSNVENYSLLRIQENAIGVLLVFVVSIAAVPVLALDLLRNCVLSTLELFANSTGELTMIYESKTDIQTRAVSKSIGSYFDRDNHKGEEVGIIRPTDEKDDRSVSDVSQMCSRIRSKLSELPGLILNAKTESLLSSIIFPETAYNTLVHKLAEINLVIFSFNRCLFNVSRIVDLSAKLHPSMESSVKHALTIRDEVLILLRRISAELLRWCSIISETLERRESEWRWDFLLNDFSLSSEEHQMRVESIHIASSSLVVSCSQFNKETYGSWIRSVLFMDRVPRDNEAQAAIIHSRILGLVSFNALFFSSTF